MSVQQKVLNIPTKLGNISGVLDRPDCTHIKATAIIMHGLKSNKDREGYLDLKNIALMNSIQAFRFDFGGHGESYDSPHWKKYGVLDQVKDLEEVVSFLLSNNLIVGKLILMPTSFSSDPSLIYSARNEIVNYLIMTSPGIGKNCLNVTDNKYRQDWWDDCVSKTQLSLEDYIKLLSSLNIPIHSLHGDADHSVPITQSEELKRIIGNNFIFHNIKGGKHKFYSTESGMKQRTQILNNIFSKI